MIATSSWLNAGTAVVDDHGRMIESNEEFAFWAGLSPYEQVLLVELLSRKCADWGEEVSPILAAHETFRAGYLEDTSVEPSDWYRYELTRVDTVKVFRLNRCLPPLDQLTEGAWDKYLNEEGPRRELYARTLRAEGQLKLLGGKWPGVLFNQRPDYTFSFISRKIEDWTGIPAGEWSRRPQRFWDVVHEADAGELQANLSRCKAGEPVTTTFRLRHIQTGRVTYILERREAILSSNGLVLGYDGAWVDITRQNIAEKRLVSAVWKETLGVLTMGMAHDFNNILAGIHSLSDTYQESVQEVEELHDAFGLIRRNAQQAIQQVQRMLSLHQGKVGQRNYYNANELVSDTLEVLRKTVRRVQVHTELAPENLPLYIDPIEFRQVLVNLTLNAADAMPEGGDIYFSTAILQELPPLEGCQGVLPKAPAVCVTVRDTGCGIPKEHLSQIFDPFFTTKPLNKGSGLGLYNARLFVEKHGGAITVQSLEGAGTTFRLWLPKANFTESDRFQAELVLGRKTLLLVEPSGKNLEVAARSLRESGFYVATVASERGAIELLHAPDYQFDAVMALVNGQGRRALQLFNEISRLKLPIKKIVQIYGSNEDEQDTTLLERADFVISPHIPPSAIAAKVREVLARV
jgi:signal transduction histidine kinase